MLIAKEVADRMVAIRGLKPAIVRCNGYISGEIKSENSKEFWGKVLKEINNGCKKG